jgi:CheY-like chemotaxis protein
MIDLNEMTVLIVDDAPMMCKSIRGMLKVLQYGKTFYFANNGLEAWNILKKEAIDLAIVDWNMPVMNGGELLGRIRNCRELRDMPFVMVTAEANREIVAETAESDIDAYILKPLTAKSMGERILNVIEKANNPSRMVYHLKRARDHEDTGDIDAAIQEAEMAMAADQKSSRPVRELGYLFFKKNDLEKAKEWLLKAAKMNDLDVFAFHYLGELYLKENKIEKALNCFEKAMSISPRHVSRGITFGKILVQKNMLNKAVEIFNKAIELSDNVLAMTETVADFCLQNEMYEYAIELFSFILNNIPTRYDIMLKLGDANEKLGKHADAVGYFIEAGKKDKENIDIKNHVAKNYIELEQVIRAEQVLKSVLDIDPENQEAKALLRQNL